MLQDIRCPITRDPLKRNRNILTSPSGHKYPIVDDVPVLLRDDMPDTLWVVSASLSAAWAHVNGLRNDSLFLDTLGFSQNERSVAERLIAEREDAVDTIVSYMIAATNGNLYRHLTGSLEHYPIPRFRLQGAGERLLDLGCNWGRWTISAARQGIRPTGLDPSLGAVLAAKRLCDRLGIDADFVVGDARWLPFRPGCFDTVFSYSVLQHFSRSNARMAFMEIARSLVGGGCAFVQMPNRIGLRCLYRRFRRGFREGQAFEIRYWSLDDLQELGSIVGPTDLQVDGYFGLGLQPSDIAYMDAKGRMAIRASEVLRSVSRSVPLLIQFADSVYLQSHKLDAGDAVQ